VKIQGNFTTVEKVAVAEPDRASEQVNETVTSVLFQPLELAAGNRPPRIVGGVASRFNVTDCVEDPPALAAEQVNVTLEVSALTVPALHPDVEAMGDSGSTTVHVTVTLLTYQPLFPSVPLT